MSVTRQSYVGSLERTNRLAPLASVDGPKRERDAPAHRKDLRDMEMMHMGDDGD
jgi:hypothetical protein